jgi:hypothetical protein
MRSLAASPWRQPSQTLRLDLERGQLASSWSNLPTAINGILQYTPYADHVSQ